MITTEQFFGIAVMLGVLLWHAQDARVIAEQPLDDLRRDIVDMRVKLDTLERTGIELEHDPDLSRYEFEMRKHPAIVTAYNTVEHQTDSAPCIAADGSNICGSSECVVANNALALGTMIELEGFGDCVVRDRMNARYSAEYMDVSFDKDEPRAWAFGVQHLIYVVK